MTIHLTTEQARVMASVLRASRRLARVQYGNSHSTPVIDSLLDIIDEATDQERMLEIERGE